MNVDVHGFAGLGVAGGDTLPHFTHVVVAAQALHTGLAVEQMVQLLGVHPGHAGQVEYRSRVDVTGAGTHNQALQRG